MPRRPRAVLPGATVAILAAASAVKAELLAAGCATLERWGYRTRVMPHALDRGPLNYAGSIEHRVADLHAAFADPSIDAVLCARGGWGSAELLPHLDARLFRANPKLLMGYSDITSLHLWLQSECALTTLHAPMAASDFGKDQEPHLPSWRCALEGAVNWHVGPAEGLRVLHGGVAEGPLTGGCISIYVEALGTPYAPVSPRGILFLEDIGTHPYQWDRMLLHLRYAGILRHVTGIVLGDMRQCCPPEENALLEATLLHSLRDFAGPICVGLRSGHVDGGNITLPLGVQVRLDASDEENAAMHFLESAVER